MRKERLSQWVICLVLIFSWEGKAFSYEKKTHQYINGQIAQRAMSGFSLDGYLKNVLGFEDGVNEFLSGNLEELKTELQQEAWRWLGEGGIQEDNPEEIWGLALSLARNDNHFHNRLEADWSKAGLNATISLPFRPYLWPVFGRSSLIWMQTKNQDPSNFFGGNWSWHDARNCFFQALTSTSRNPFNSLTSILPGIAAELNTSEISGISIEDDEAEYEILVARDGKIFSFQLKFVKDDLGLWKIWRY